MWLRCHMGPSVLLGPLPLLLVSPGIFLSLDLGACASHRGGHTAPSCRSVGAISANHAVLTPFSRHSPNPGGTQPSICIDSPSAASKSPTIVFFLRLSPLLVRQRYLLHQS